MNKETGAFAAAQRDDERWQQKQARLQRKAEENDKQNNSILTGDGYDAKVEQ